MERAIESLRSTDWQALGQRALLVAVTIAVVLAGAKILRSLSIRLTARLLRPRAGESTDHHHSRRAETLLPLILEVERYLIYFMASVTVLAQLGIDTGAILASVGVVGLAVGFGAQNLVKDVISGFFLLFDGLLAVGDVVRINDKTSGSVEAIGLRNTQVRDYTGLLWMVPNGDLRQFGNFNRGWTRAVVDINVALEADVRKAMGVLREVGKDFAEELGDKVLEPPEVQAVLGLGEEGVTVRLAIKMEAMTHWDAEREMRLRIKEAFEKNEIAIPYPRRVVVDRRQAGG